MQTKLVWTALLLATLGPPHFAADADGDAGFARLVFTPGQAGRVALVNHALAPVALSRCGPVLEIQQGEGETWDVVAAQSRRGCEEEPRYLMPGDSGTMQFACPTRPGTYRLSLAVRLERPSLDPLSGVTRSPSFDVPGIGPCGQSYAR